MCQYKTLYHDKNEGYIIHCTICGNIQLGFGNISVTFTLKAFYGFYESIQLIRSDQPFHHDPFYKCITISTPCEGVNFLLSPKELHQLNLMLNAADTELRSQELISLFRNH